MSVIIVARNEEERIGRCLDSLAWQDYPADLWEDTVFDDSYTESTVDIDEA